MKQRPTLETERLIMRPFRRSDAPDVQRLAGAREIAAGTLRLPHPYGEGMAERWIGSHQETFERGEGIAFAVTLRGNGRLIGAISLMAISTEHERAEMGYWIGVPYWNQGYCTEAARAVIRYGFEVLELNRIQASHFARNPASGRVMQKIGMTREGCQRQCFKKWGEFVDLVCHSVLRQEYEAGKDDA